MIGPPLYDRIGGGLISLVTDGPIIGSVEPAVRIATGGQLSTGDLAQSQPGDASFLASFCVEMWFRYDTLPGADRVIMQGPRGTGAAVPQYEFVLTTLGAIAFAVYGNSTQVTVVGPTLSNSTWYHLAGRLDSGNVLIHVNGVPTSTSFGANASIRSRDATATGNLDVRLNGATVSGNYDFAYFALYTSSVGTARMSEHYRAGTAQGFRQQNVATRIGATLDMATSDAPRSIGAATRSVTDVYLSGNAPLDVIRDAKSAEATNSAFFCSSGGALTFLGANHRSSAPYNSAKQTFGDGAGELPYLGITIDYSESFLFNYWSVTRQGTSLIPGAEQVSFDQTSINRYFKRAQLVTGIPVVADSDAANIGTAMLAKYKDPMQRITGLNFDMSLPDVADAVLSLELMDCIRVLRTPPGGGARIDQTVFVQKIDVNGSNDGTPWTASIGVSPL